MARELRLQLKRGLTYQCGPFHFRRGTPITMPDEQTYHRILRRGYVTDPDQQFNFIHPLGLKKAKPDAEVLIIRDMGMGDVLMASVAIRALKEKYPQLRFIYAVDSRYVDLFRDCTFLHRVAPIPEVVGRYPFVLDLRGYSERAPKQHVQDRIEIFGEGLGVHIEDFTFTYAVSSAERTEAVGLLRDLPERRMALVVRASDGVRSWPWAHTEALCRMATKDGWGVALIDHQHFELELPGLVNLTGQGVSLRGVAAVLSECDVAVAPDTGPLHLAEAVGTPTVGIFSVIDPAVRITHYQHVEALWRGNERKANGKDKALPCCPCWGRGCAELLCLTGITPEMVMAKATEMAGRARKGALAVVGA